jgi:glucosylceramidase
MSLGALRRCSAGAAPLLLALLAPPSTAIHVEWTQTARNGQDVTLMEEQPPITLRKPSHGDGPMPKAVISVDRGTHHQEFAGFGGAFTEAAAINWRKLSSHDQDEMIKLYFADPSEGGLGYTMGRVPIGSCDFSPETYTFDDTENDVSLDHFDNKVQVRSSGGRREGT